jgi:hypothetical protein
MKKTTNNRTTRRRTFRALRAILALNLKVVLIVSMVLSTLLYTSDANTTLAYFYDFEYSEGNRWDAGAIDFVLDDQAWQLPEAVNDLEIGETVSRNLVISEDDSVEASNPFVYRIEIELGDDTSMCQYLDLDLFAEDDLVPVYSGLLTDLVDDASGIHTWPETDEWRFEVSLPDGAPESHGDACDFDIVVSGWQLRHDMPFLGGYHDIETTINSLAAAATVCTPVGFEYDANDNPIVAGQVIDDEFAAWGLNIASENHHNARPDLAIIFDSSNPTGEDEDLGTPNQDFAGPGIGLGGQQDELGENSQSLGNVLITAEDDVDDDNDGYIDDPDDERNGATFAFDFDANTWVDYVELLDMEEAGGKIYLHHDDTGSNFDVIDIPVLGNNSFQRLVIDDHDVKTMYIDLPGSGAIANFCFDPIEVEPQEPGILGVVLNEVLPNPEGSDSQAGLLGEWVELYNNSDTEVDLADWYIEDGVGSANRQTISTSNTHTGVTTIGAKGSGNEWLVVFMSGAILNNTGDTVSFYNSSDELVDQYVYGNHPNDGDDDTKDSVGGDNGSPTGSETSVQEGKSDARIPDGTGSWIDPVPTPGGINILTEGQDEQPSIEETQNQSEDPEPEQLVEETSPEESEQDDTINEEESVQEQIGELEELAEEIQEPADDSDNPEELMNREDEENDQEQLVEDEEPTISGDDTDDSDEETPAAVVEDTMDAEDAEDPVETITETPSDEGIDEDNQQESLVREDDEPADELVSETPNEA